MLFHLSDSRRQCRDQQTAFLTQGPVLRLQGISLAKFSVIQSELALWHPMNDLPCYLYFAYRQPRACVEWYLNPQEVGYFMSTSAPFEIFIFPLYRCQSCSSSYQENQQGSNRVGWGGMFNHLMLWLDVSLTKISCSGKRAQDYTGE
jgi:hypothetical protein